MDYNEDRIRHTSLFHFALRCVGEWSSLGCKYRMWFEFYVCICLSHGVRTRLDITKLTNIRICWTILSLVDPKGDYVSISRRVRILDDK